MQRTQKSRSGRRLDPGKSLNCVPKTGKFGRENFGKTKGSVNSGCKNERELTDEMIRRANPQKVNPWSRSTVDRRRRVCNLYRRIIKVRPEAKQHPKIVVAILSEMFQPSTAVTYTRTLRSLLRLHQTDPRVEEWKESIRWLRMKAGRNPPRKATPLQPRQLRCLTPQRQTDLMIAFMTISASRHADLIGATCSKTPNPEVLKLHLSIFKSDIFGEKNVTKHVSVPRSWVTPLFRMMNSPPSYRATHERMKQIHPSLTPHSARRGAVTILSTIFPSETIALLTGHSRGILDPTSVRRYIEPTINSLEAQQQIIMSAHLAKIIDPTKRLPTPMQPRFL